MELLNKIKNAGVIGAGGAGFPTHVKLDTKADIVLMNGAECEPLLRVDQQIMELHPKEVISGLMIAKQIVSATQAIIGIKRSHPELIGVMRDAIRELSLENEVLVKELPDVYPAGDEQVLIYELTGRIVPETKLPSEVGCVVINTETSMNIYHAAIDIPVTKKYLTITGEVPNPITLCVPIGTGIKDVFRLSGLEDPDGYDVIEGGPMMGSVLKDLNGSVTKKTKGYIVLHSSHHLIHKKSRTMDSAKRLNRSACEQCSLCTDLCPRHLLGHSTVPHKMVRAMAFNHPAGIDTTAALTCCQCNLCEYFSCPAGIGPKSANLYYMGKLREQNIKHTPKDSYRANSLRPFRMIPSQRLIWKLGLHEYDLPAPLCEDITVDPASVCINLKDHIGAPAVPVVSEGDPVRRGQLIAEIPQGALGAAVYASIDGKVASISDTQIRIIKE